ncbi:MAG: 16S rRNA (uracil(1498)-N(3))-methyltransferase [Deltaproteobacteria bacterium]|nr:16S rRNA (uracil(1498)-N(3))-methyltransferase [Deltaproteobacteria bacterium]
MRRFYLENAPVNDMARIGGDEARHIEKVLRLGSGDGLELFDASGCVYLAAIESLGRGKVVARICSRGPGVAETGAQIVLCQAVVKSQKMDLIIEKCTELGATAFQPFFAQRSVPRWDADRAARRVQHWQAVARAALKQSGARRLPCVAPVVGFSAMLAQPFADCCRVMLWEGERAAGLREVLAGASGRGIAFLVGPEGGFTDDEVDQARQRGFQVAGLGERILRAETAAITVTALAACAFGVIGG